MQEAHIDHSELDRLVENLTQAPQVLTEAKRKAFEAAAPKLQKIVQDEIGGSGRVRNWQEAYVGSGGGYAAARPRAETYAESRGLQTYPAPRKERPKPRYAVGYITNAITSGHGPPRNRAGYCSSGKRVAGKHFYQHAQDLAGAVAEETAEEIVQALIDHLEG